MTVKIQTIPDPDQMDVTFALRLFLEAAVPGTTVHQLIVRAIAEIERLRSQVEDLRP